MRNIYFLREGVESCDGIEKQVVTENVWAGLWAIAQVLNVAKTNDFCS